LILFKQLEYEFYDRYYAAEIKYYLGLHYSMRKVWRSVADIVISVESNRVSMELQRRMDLMHSERVKRPLKEC